MGERVVQVGSTPIRLQGTSSTDSRGPSTTTRSKHEDDYYMDRMREILTGFPNTGPPSYPVQILEHVYMGNQRNADNVEVLRRYGITHVFSCAGQRRYENSRSPYAKDSGIKEFLLISADDTEDFDIARHFDEAIAFLDRVKKAKGKALVHCNLGVNRSGAFVAAYLMAEQKRTLLEVINYLKVKRFVVLSNKGFRRQLIQFARSRGRLDPIIRNVIPGTHHQSSYDASQRNYSEEVRREEEGMRAVREIAEIAGGGKSKGNRVEADTIKRPQTVGNQEQSREEFKKLKNLDRGSKQNQEGKTTSIGTLEARDGGRLQPHSDTDEPDARQNRSKRNDATIGDPYMNSKNSAASRISSEEPSLRERLWTLPRYSGRGEKERLERSPAVEVIVSDHESAPGRLLTPAEDKSLAVFDKSDGRCSSKGSLRQLEPVYETRSCDAAVAGSSTAIGGSTGTTTGSSGGRTSAAESMSAKISGFFSLLGPKKQPFRSTSYSNVSSSKSPMSSLASLPPPLAAGERSTSTSSGSLQTSASGTSLSTTRPLRIYTRSSTDTEIYRARHEDTSSGQTAGQFCLPRLSPRSSKS